MKRFTDVTKWTQNKWFRKLDSDNKLFWLYLLDQCDNVGVWEEDIELAEMLIGVPYSIESLLKVFGNKVKVICNGRKWWIKDFINFQYGELDETKITNKPHQSYIKSLKKHRLWIDYKKTIQSVKEKDKDKDKEKDKEKDKVKYAEFVKLTEKEHQTCIEKHGKSKTEKAIQALNDYKQAHDKKYKSDYGALNSWVWDKLEQNNSKNNEEIIEL